MTWTSTDYTAITTADDFHVAPNRVSGEPGTPTWIWSVGVDGDVYIRGYNGQASSWYQSAIAFGAGIARAGGQERPVAFEAVADPALLDRIDAAYRAKYDPSPYVEAMVGARSRAATVRVLPKLGSMTIANAYVATSATDQLVPGTIERREVGPKDVLIDIRWAGICHSDIHTVRGEWGQQTYPLTVGHEIVGEVAAVGAEVTKHSVGDHVGVGCMVNSCRECDYCKAGEEQYCANGNIGTYASKDVDGTITQGGYSTSVVVDEDFVLRVPESIPYEKAAPLLCAGITTYSPLRHWGAGPGKKVAVVGLGGLGHMAVKLAHAMGAEVTVLSQSLKKQEDGLRLGADHYYATSDPETFKALRNQFDLIINTVSAGLDVTAYLRMLAIDGSLVNVGAPPEPMSLNVFALIGGRRSYAGSAIGGIAETQEMLDFCAEHGVAPEVEIIGADKINEAWARVLASDVRYRFVIDTSTLTA